MTEDEHDETDYELVEDDEMDPEEEGFNKGLDDHFRMDEQELKKREDADEAAYERAFSDSKKKK